MPRKTTPALIEATVTLPPAHGFEAHPVLLEMENLWLMLDQAGKPGPAMNFAEMNRAKVRLL